jgi:hypothetical protein
MNDLAREKLCKMVGSYGRALCDDPQRCEALLRDLCAGHRSEVNVLVCALKERVAAELLASSASTPREVLLARLTDRLEDNLGLSHEAARWSVESWALALGAIAPSELAQAHASVGSARGGIAVSGAPGPTPSSTAASVGGASVSPGSPWSPGNPAGSASPPAPLPRSRSRSAWIAAGVLAALTFAGGTAATVVLQHRNELDAQRRQLAEDYDRKRRDGELRHQRELKAARDTADAAARQAGELRKKLAVLTGSLPDSVLSGGPPRPVPPDIPSAADALAVAQQLIRVAENRSNISGAIMKKHLQARGPNERLYGKDSPLVDRAYQGYPYKDRIRAYELMGAEASAAAAEARALTLESRYRDPLVDLLGTQAEAFSQIRQALAYEQDHGYTATKPRWDAERKGPFVEAQRLWNQLRSVYVPWPGKPLHSGKRLRHASL